MRRIRQRAASRGKHHRHVTTAAQDFEYAAARPSRGALHVLNPSGANRRGG
jgi:hypothetical protein